MSDPVPTTTIRRARATLERSGWIVLPPAPPAPMMADQCEYPDRRGAPGECCTNLTRRSRKTSHGWMWLCAEHISQPESRLFDERLTCHAG